MADNGKGKLEKRTVELGEYDEGMDMYEIKSGLALDDMIAWPVSGFREGLKTTTNVDEGMVEEYPDDGDFPVIRMKVISRICPMNPGRQ